MGWGTNVVVFVSYKKEPFAQELFRVPRVSPSVKEDQWTYKHDSNRI